MSRRPLPSDPPVLPHPAEDLSADDDLLSWILVDQLGCMPNTKLGVHPQQVKFVGPVFKTEEVLNIVHEVGWIHLDEGYTTDEGCRRLYRGKYRKLCSNYKSMSFRRETLMGTGFI
jgi:hypothetical protein